MCKINQKPSCDWKQDQKRLLYHNNFFFFFSDLTMNGVQAHSHGPTNASIYLGVLFSHVQNFVWVLCYPFVNNSFAINVK